MRLEGSATEMREKTPWKRASWKESWLPSRGVPLTCNAMGDGFVCVSRMRAATMAWVGVAVVFDRLIVEEEVERDKEMWTFGLQKFS